MLFTETGIMKELKHGDYQMDRLIVYPDGIDQPGEEFKVANGFVSRVVSSVSDNNIPDAHRVAKILNKFFADGGKLEDI